MAHHSAAATAIEAGVHVLIEKPMAPTAALAWDLVRRAERAGVVLMVGYTFQLTDAATRAGELLAGGELGRLQLISGVYASAMSHLFTGSWTGEEGDPLLRPKPSTFNDPAIAGDGQSQSQLTHLLGALLAATDLRPQSVTAIFRPSGEPLDLRNALTIDFVEVIAAIASTGTMPPGSAPVWELRYFAERGTVTHDLTSGTLTLDRGHGVEIIVGAAATEGSYPAGAVAPRFIDVIEGKRPNPATGVVGARAALDHRGRPAVEPFRRKLNSLQRPVSDLVSSRCRPGPRRPDPGFRARLQRPERRSKGVPGVVGREPRAPPPVVGSPQHCSYDL